MAVPKIVWKITPEQMVARWFVPALESVIDQLTAALDAAFDDDIWQWDRETVRKNGQTVGSPRDLIDQGTLKNSLVVMQVSARYWRFVWESGHAATVLLGGISRADGSRTPTRNWIDYVLSNVNLTELYAQEISSRMI